MSLASGILTGLDAEVVLQPPNECGRGLLGTGRPLIEEAEAFRPRFPARMISRISSSHLLKLRACVSMLRYYYAFAANGLSQQCLSAAGTLPSGADKLCWSRSVELALGSVTLVIG